MKFARSCYSIYRRSTDVVGCLNETATAMRSYDIYIPVFSEQEVYQHTESGTSGKSHELIKDF
jgi:hypothetical protein